MPESKLDSITDIAFRWAEDTEPQPSDIPDVLYHYTDANGLIGMLRSNEVWATDYRFLNDRSEIAHTRSLVRSLISEEMKKTNDSLVARLYAQILQFEGAGNLGDPYVFSFSEEADDLSQWRGYAREGQGFTIGFCAKSIYKASSKKGSGFSFCKVVYDENKQWKSISKALGEMVEELRRVTKASKTDEDMAISHTVDWFDLLVGIRATANKHHSFRKEGEWRTISLINEDDRHEVKIRSSGVRLVPYLPVGLRSKEMEKLPILRVGIGPGFTSGDEVYAVQALCNEAGYKPEIYSADTPYRRV
ncbi:MAG: hypothetical protein QOJ91_2788 [Sphingomonadales bacterium]|nr:hypothetical protein [Sphingomonadales bacterium]